jgi:hypothetical protein
MSGSVYGITSIYIHQAQGPILQGIDPSRLACLGKRALLLANVPFLLVLI